MIDSRTYHQDLSGVLETSLVDRLETLTLGKLEISKVQHATAQHSL